MFKTISILSETENVGKTTTAVNLAVALGLFEKKTLLIDSSTNKNKLLDSLGIKKSENIIVPTDLQFLQFIGIPFDKPEFLNSNFFNNIDDSFDYIIINSPNIENKYYDFILTATDWIIIPFELKQKLLNDLYRLVANLKEQSKDHNYSYKLDGILLNRFNGDHDFNIDIFEKDNIFFNSKIPTFDNIYDNVFFSDIKSNISGAYLDFAIEIIEKTSIKEIK